MPDIETKEASTEATKPPSAVARSAQRRNNPSNPADPPQSPIPSGLKYLPKPLRFSMKPDEFFLYWSGVDQSNPDRACAYVYRTWPMINRQVIDPEARKYIDKMDKAFEDPQQWREEMLHRFGSGNYKLILNDSGGTTKSVGQTLISDLRDSDYPPVISNMEELVMDDPSNQSYIEALRQKGLLPGEQAMASQEAMGIMAGTIKDLANQAARPKEEKTQAQPQTPEAVATKSLEMQQQAFSAGLNLAKEATAAQVAAAESKAANQQTDPKQSLGLLKDLIGVIQGLKPELPPAQASPSGDLTKLVESFMGREAALQGKILEILQAQITALQTAKNPDAQPASKDDLVSSLERLAKVKDTVQDLFGGGEREDERPEKAPPPWMRLAESALSTLPALGTALLGMSYNLALARGKAPGEPIHPGAIPIAEIPAPDQTETPSLNAAGATLGPAITSMLRTIEGPFLLYLNNPDKTGADFAEWLSFGYGEVRYQAMREMGKDTILALLLSYPPIAGVIKQVPARTDAFLEDFLHAFEEGPGDEGNAEAKAVS